MVWLPVQIPHSPSRSQLSVVAHQQKLDGPPLVQKWVSSPSYVNGNTQHLPSSVLCSHVTSSSPDTARNQCNKNIKKELTFAARNQLTSTRATKCLAKLLEFYTPRLIISWQICSSQLIKFCIMTTYDNSVIPMQSFAFQRKNKTKHSTYALSDVERFPSLQFDSRTHFPYCIINYTVVFLSDRLSD